jgi:hypothetical protein
MHRVPLHDDGRFLHRPQVGNRTPDMESANISAQSRHLMWEIQEFLTVQTSHYSIIGWKIAPVKGHTLRENVSF